jgi:tRNA(fMet)-specific endonuclease VapC
VKYLLDTNILSAIAASKSIAVNRRFIATPRADLCTCDVVWHEVKFGLAANANIAQKLKPMYDLLFEGLMCLGTPQEVWTRAASIRAQLKQKGTPIGPFDLLIAATAVEYDLVLVTNNLSEFLRVDGLKCETWFDV